MKTHIRILVVGDSQVGKSTLISTLVSQHFSEEVPALMHDVTLPREESEHDVLTTVMDSPGRLVACSRRPFPRRRLFLIVLNFFCSAQGGRAAPQAADAALRRHYSCI